MNEMELQQLIRTPDFVNCFRSGEITEFLRGKFVADRMPHMHTVTLSDGSRLALRFTNTIRYLLDSKLKRRTDRQSYLSYMELRVFPVGLKGYCKTFNDKLILIAQPMEANLKKHQDNIALLTAEAEKYGIDLTVPNSWSTVYNENYKNKAGR